jgi:hypothetical protein
MRILTGEIEDAVPDDGKDPAARALGRKDGAARAKSMTPGTPGGDCEAGGKS